MKAPFEKGDRVIVPGRFQCLVVTDVWQARGTAEKRVTWDGKVEIVETEGAWRVRASFESGFGWYEGLAHEFRRNHV